MTEAAAPTYQELLEERVSLRTDLSRAQGALLVAARELTILHAELTRLKKGSGVRKLDPKAKDAFSRPYR